jgi:hypothetical protein
MFLPTTYLPCPHDPRPEPARRWRRCRYLIRHRLWLDPLRDDDLTCECLRYLYDRRACRSVAERRALARHYPAIAAAHRFFVRAEPLRRAELEARLLAGQPDEEIAERCGLPALAVAACHDLFFDVRDDLETDDYIYGLIVGLEGDAQLSADDHEVLLKLLGYAHGPPMVDAVLRYFRDPPSATLCLGGLDGPALDDLRQRLQVRVLIQAMVAPADDLVRPEAPTYAAQAQAPAGEGAAPPSPADTPAPLANPAPPPEQSVAAFLREQMIPLAPAGPPAVLPLADVA